MSDVGVLRSGGPALARPDAGARGRSFAAGFTEVCFGVALAILWALGHSFDGIEGDARIYMARALADLDPAGVGRDLMFTMDGQSSFSLYRLLARTLAAHLSLGPTVATLSILNMAVWFAAAAALARAVAPGRAAILVLAAVCVLPRLYTPWNLLAAGEAIPVPRPLAEAGVLFALAALCHGRTGWCLATLLVAAAVHPIMAAPGFGVLLIVLGLRDRRWLVATGVLGLAVVVAAVLGAPVLSRLTTVVDPVWRGLLLERNPYLFLHLWPAAGWSGLTIQTLTIAIGSTWLLPKARVLFAASLAVAVLGCAASWLLGDVAHSLLVLQAQLWRALWLPAVLAPFAAGLCLWHMPGGGAASRIALAGLALAWAASDLVPLAPAAALVAAILWFGLRRFAFGRAAVLAAWGLCLGLIAVSVAMASVALHTLIVRAGIDLGIPWHRIWALGLPIVPVLAATWWAVRHPEAPAARVGVPLAVALGLVFVATTWDGRTPAHADSDAATLKPDLVALLASRPGEVLWVDADDGWYWARRPNYNSPTQGGGIVFSRDLAIEFHRRAEAVVEAGLSTRNILDPWHAAISARAADLDPAKIAAFCARSDAPAWIVSSLDPGAMPPPALRAKIWSPPLAQTKLYVLGDDIAWRHLDRYAVIPCREPPSSISAGAT